ncbi:B-cell receptor CD22-like [Spea bombifrons]|uniref:B-cell receptor CD22-like n=1 Tax=Spea bombifrons TaxID=233779 RepID=UPI002349CAC3|nr:B-cell receptor CD22-like [Spea bombifrons]
MNLHHVFIEGIFSMFILQGWFSKSACESWSFRFPRTVKVLKRSSATVPCSFTSPAGYGDVNIIWYINQFAGYPQALNEKSPSEVKDEYRGRTSLVGDGPNSCSLRINDIVKEAEFYPGIDKNINSFDLQDRQIVKVSFTGCSEDSSCRDWSFSFPKSINVLRGSCVEIPCSFSHPKAYKDFNLIWYEEYGNSPIYNKLNPWDVAAGYSGRTYLVGNGTNSCSLRMNDVKESGRYYPGVNEDINSYVLNDGRSIQVIVTDSLSISLRMETDNMLEGRTVSINCSVEHTCASRPPTLTWNKLGQLFVHHEALTSGTWRVTSQIIYTPMYEDNNTYLTCMATYPNGKTKNERTLLNIHFAPKNTTLKMQDKGEIREGDNATLLCETTANPDVSYEWYKDGEKLKESSKKLTAWNVSWKNERYYCIAKNNVGSGQSATLELPVQYSAKEVKVKAERRGSAMKLVCDFLKSNPEPVNYTWYLAGSPIPEENEQTLTVDRLSQSNGYSCAICNDVGCPRSELYTVTLDEVDLPVILGTVAGVFFVFLFVVFLYFFSRRKKIQKSPSSKIPASVTSGQNGSAAEQIAMSDHLYGNIHTEPHYTNQHLGHGVGEVRSPAKRNGGASNNQETLYAQPQKDTNDIIYTSVQHRPRSEMQEPRRGVPTEDIEYATVRR